MKRFGPLHALDDGLAVGDPGRNHLLLTPAGIAHRDGDEVTHALGWDAVESVSIDVPTSRFRFPGAVSGLLSAIIVALIQENPGLGPEDGVTVIRSRGVDTTLPLGRHHAGGYWAPTVSSSRDLLNRFIADAQSRDLLRHPQTLVDTVARAARH